MKRRKHQVQKQRLYPLLPLHSHPPAARTRRPDASHSDPTHVFGATSCRLAASIKASAIFSVINIEVGFCPASTGAANH